MNGRRRPGAPALLPTHGPALPSGCSGGLLLTAPKWGFDGGSRRIRWRWKGHDRRLVGRPVAVRPGRTGRWSGVPLARHHGGPGSGVPGQRLVSCLGSSRLSAVGRLRRVGFRSGLMDVHANSRQLMSLSTSGSSTDRSQRQIEHHTHHHPIPASHRSGGRWNEHHTQKIEAPETVKNHSAELNQTTVSATASAPPSTGSVHPGNPRSRSASIFAAKMPYTRHPARL